ncbi:MAG: hypothetical protein MUD17_05110 [Gemmatimonadaceae bacterium]|nr:hypothetical protein [Gemmatimonadaceae bacterium]
MLVASPMASASAQECVGGLALGTASSAVGGAFAGAGADRSTVAAYERLGARIQLGAHAGLLGTSFTSTSVQLAGVSANWRPGAMAESGLRACPYVRATWLNGPDEGRFPSRQLQGATGLSVGHAVPVGAGLTLVPFGRLGVLHLRERSGLSDVSRNVGEAGLGVGLRFGSGLVVTPFVQRPFATGTRVGAAEPTYSLSIRLGLGR